jgi:hypothetical protein
MNTHIFILHLVEAQHIIKRKSTIYGLMHQCHARSKQAYSTNQNPIYFAFKLPNYVPQLCQPLMNKCYKKKDFNANIRY